MKTQPRRTDQHAPSQVLALFANGRVEEFLDCATLTPPQMRDPSFVPRIAAGLARFHGAGVNLVPKAPGVFATIRRWLAMARGLDFHDEPRREAYEALDFDDLASEVDQTEAACAGAASPLVWGHNDVISGNIIALQRPGFDSDAPDYGGELALIDYEYGGWNPRGFDFGEGRAFRGAGRGVGRSGAGGPRPRARVGACRREAQAPPAAAARPPGVALPHAPPRSQTSVYVHGW